MLSPVTISVLIPTYNRADLLKSAIQSVLDQTLPCTEIIVVDDGSTDHTTEVVTRAQVTSPIPIVLVSQKNQGMATALNTAISRAHGEWIGFLDSDDLWLPEKLCRQYNAIERFPECRLCFSDARYVGNPRLSTTAFKYAHKVYVDEVGKIANPLLFSISPPHGVYLQTCLIRSDAIRETGSFDPVLKFGEDTDYLFRVALKTPFCYVNYPLVEIDRTLNRLRNTDMLRKHRARLETLVWLYEKWLKICKLEQCDAEVLRMMHEKLRATYGELAVFEKKCGNSGEAKRAIRSAFSNGFDLRLAIKYLAITLLPALASRMIDKEDRVIA